MKTILVVLLQLTFVSAAFAAGYTDPVTGMEFVFVKGGCYKMGEIIGNARDDEKPVHEVCVDDFYIGKYEVTQKEYQKVMGKNPSFFKECGPSCPVDDVSWEDTQEFIRQLNALSGKNFRLPYEAEWEYAARSGGKNEQFSGTSDPNKLGSYAWFEVNSGKTTHKAGTRRPNGLGIYDMSGNVWEWCNDLYDGKYYNTSPQKNPHGAETGSDHVFRGGGWDYSADGIRTSIRDLGASGQIGKNSGFRLALPAVK